MRLIWSDECALERGAPPDERLWGLHETDRWQPAGELQVYTRQVGNAYHNGIGHLVITARQVSGGYTSARLSARHARHPALFQFGRFEARLLLPTGTGVWPAWWLLGEDDCFGWPDCGEIDIMEAPCSPSTRGQVHQGTHSPHASGTGEVDVGVTPSTGDWGSGFHTYAVEWTPGRLDFFIDQRHTGIVTRADVEARGGTWVFDDRPQSPILNVAVGGDWAGPPDGTWREQSMLVDWVRIYR